MPGRSHHVLRLAAVLTAVQTAAVLLATKAAAAPTPSPSPSASDDRCDLIVGPAKDYCERESGEKADTSTLPNDVTTTLDPLSSLAQGCADAASWTVDKLSEAVNETADVDFTNMTFLKQYAVVFAASAILTLVLWLLAVTKRAVRGVPFTTAISEAIGFLWLTVLASAFTPLILYTVVSATDGVSDVIAQTTGNQTDTFFGTFSEALKQGNDIGGGPIMLILVSLISIVAAGVLYMELFLRAVLLYVGALLGVVVYAGLVDKDLWGHVRRWAGIMIAIILVKPVIVIVLGLAGALTTEEGPDSLAAIVSGLAIILLAIFASAMIYRFVPGFGDEIANSRNNRIMRGAEGKAAAVISSPATLVAQGIKTHSSRADNNGGGGGSSTPRPSNPASGGVAAHSSRNANGGGGPVPATAPPPRTSPANTPHASNARNSNRTGGEGR
ncbi:energy-coupling factor transporter transmembrane protein EcfT [Streptomyces sp. CA-210063]|uniref:energy-coupling factor transporter transmembrane protein EcfT n=1 Tax=Streptomyces sp. CA-210063 TaxID=2801029 RepID=UPI00214B0431|nr:energy-coupling factor transporter transmembrane protein EcfT [Streptomyces sp. CA-210063]UUU32852.1 energy-coupling factor transporter transmembrane protein EcfT [Streptomyces sp. CA-210063]